MRAKSLWTLLAISGAILAAMAANPRKAAAMEAPKKDSDFFAVAVWYGGGKARAPMLERVDAASAERWGRDLDQIKSVGFNTVKCWVDWATAQPRPDEFRFENLELLMKLAEERGLRVLIQLYLDSAPDWVGERYPDANFVDRSGAVIRSQASPGFCIDHAGVRGEVEKFLRELSARANRSKALYGWDVWSEPHVINWAWFPYLSNAEFCFCPHTQARFRDWLKAKYGTLDALNLAWYRGFERWDQVEPPRASTILSYTDYLDWREFITDKLTGDLKTRVDSIRRADKGHPITSHAAVPGLFTSPTDGYGDPDDWMMSATADSFGTSIYPKHAASVRPWPHWQMAAGLDFSRSAGRSYGKGFWIGELQAGQGVTGMRIQEPVVAGDLEYWMWKVLSHGARQISVYAWYPMNSGYESNGYGLINLDGTLTDRSRAAGAVAAKIHRSAPEILATEPARAEIAVLYNRLSHMVGGAQPSLARLGNAPRDSMMGLHRAFTEAQVPVDFVHPDDVTQGRLGQYKILFLPYPVMLWKNVGEAVARYIQEGGTVVAEARLAWNDERGFSTDIIPGFGLDEVFGARETIIRPVEKAAFVLEAAGELPGMKAGEAVAAEAFEEELEPLAGARVLARFANGAPAVVARDYGKGKAILIGSFVAMAYQRQTEESTKRFLQALARGAGVEAPVEVSGKGTERVEVRRLVSEGAQFVFAFNHGEEEADATVSVRLPWPAGEGRDLASDQRAPLEEAAGKVRFRRKLAPRETVVIRIGRR
jgi:beta-galactosidase